MGVFQHFTYPARAVVVHAQEEAFRLNHNWIGTEHLLLGVLGEPEAVGARALDHLGVHVDSARDVVVRMIGTGSEPPSGHIPFTPRAKRVMELAAQESVHLGHHYIGSGHLLLSLVREEDGIAAQALLTLGADAESVRSQVLQLLGAGVTEPGPTLPTDGVGPMAEVHVEESPSPEWALQSVLFVLAAITAVLVGPPDSGLETAGLILLALGVVVSVVKPIGRIGRWLRTVAPLVFAVAALIFVADSLI